MSGVNLAEEHRRALVGTRPNDLSPLLTAGVKWETIAAVAPAMARIAVSGATYQPDPDSGIAFLIPVRVDSPVSPEAADPTATVSAGAIVDIVACHPRHPRRWALRTGVAEWLGAIPPQYLDPDPIRIWRSPIAWLRAGGRGLVILSHQPTDAYRILASCRGGIVAEDAVHSTELARLDRPWPMPRIMVISGPRHVA